MISTDFFSRVFLVFLLLAVFSSESSADSCYEAAIMSPTPFMGINDEVFRLDDGSVWKVKYEYEYLYEYYPNVVICPASSKLKIDGKELNVARVSSSTESRRRTAHSSEKAPDICNCKGYDGPGGPCYSGPGGAAYDGPGGAAYNGPGGPCYAGPGGPAYDGPGGPAYDGPGGPAYDGPGGAAYDGPGGPCYDGPGGAAYDGPGGPCYDGPGGTGEDCPKICK